MVVLIIGILSGTGVGVYSQVAEETRKKTISNSVSSFLSACRQRASLRGVPLRLVKSTRGISIEETPNFHCSTIGISTSSIDLLQNLVFTATQTLLSGNSVEKIPIEIFLSEGRLSSLSIPILYP
ncbi:hypothetical protein HYY75_05775 [bacterium]|nr:hypothetical protein [bacterium]